MVTFLAEGPQAEGSKEGNVDEQQPTARQRTNTFTEGPSARDQIKVHMSQRVESEKLFFRQAVGLGTRLMLSGLGVGLVGMLLGLPYLHLPTASGGGASSGSGLAPWQELASYLVQLLGVTLLLAGVVVLSACP
jgi:hypothetical protein